MTKRKKPEERRPPGRRTLPVEKKLVMIGTRVPPAVKRRIEILAKQWGYTRGKALRYIIEESTK